MFLTLEGGYEVVVSHRQRYTSKFTHDSEGGFPSAGGTRKLISRLIHPMTGVSINWEMTGMYEEQPAGEAALHSAVIY